MATLPDAGFRRELGPSRRHGRGGRRPSSASVSSRIRRTSRGSGRLPSLILLSWRSGASSPCSGASRTRSWARGMPMLAGSTRIWRAPTLPAVGFLYGIALLFIVNGGGIGAVAIVFGGYLERAIDPMLGPAGIGPWPRRRSSFSRSSRAGRPRRKVGNNTLMETKVLGIAGLMLLALLRRTAPLGQRLRPRASSPSPRPLLLPSCRRRWFPSCSPTAAGRIAGPSQERFAIPRATSPSRTSSASEWW